ncbi:2OG-Fe(II) oxygenase [Xylogone sp. PMI_703]|nr:2OG-Fe(II) oxygenase [Xylogone sp. PMI_703]
MAGEIIPLIDMAPYLAAPRSEEAQDVIKDIYKALSTWGFFLLTGTQVTLASQTDLLQAAKEFFALPLEQKLALDVTHGGVAWRGYMPLGGEHTHGQQDWKEGFYIGPEHDDDHPLTGMPLHGHNRFPDSTLPNMRGNVMAYVEQVSQLGKALTDMISLSLGLDECELHRKFLYPEPVVLFRCFMYAPSPAPGDAHPPAIQKERKSYGIGEHTDFGYLTILKADSPGLQILSPSDKWVDVPVIENSFIVNVGDMLDQLTSGRFCSRPHRVQRPSPTAAPRYSFPLFFDFAWGADMRRLSLDHLPPLTEAETTRAHDRWGKTTFRDVNGTWSQYLARKVQKVFPDLKLPDFEPNTASSTRFTRVVNVTPV